VQISDENVHHVRELMDEVGTSKTRSRRRKPVFSSLISLDSSVLRNGKSDVFRGARGVWGRGTACAD
jgi:hypothetical protein